MDSGNGVEPAASGSEAAGSNPEPVGSNREPVGSNPEPVTAGPDLARAALAAARARNAASRSGAGRGAAPRSGNAASLRRRRWSDPGPDRRDPAPLGVTMRTWVSRAGVGADLTRATVLGRWAEIVGPAIAAHAAPVSLVDGELLLQAESTAWAAQLRLLTPTIINKINAVVGRGAVKRVRTQGPSGPSWKFGFRHVPGRGPRDTYG